MQNFAASWRPMNKIILIYCRMCNFSLIFSEQFWLNLILLVRLHFGIVRDYPRRHFVLFQMECHMVEQLFCFVPNGESCGWTLTAILFCSRWSVTWLNSHFVLFQMACHAVDQKFSFVLDGVSRGWTTILFCSRWSVTWLNSYFVLFPMESHEVEH